MNDQTSEARLMSRRDALSTIGLTTAAATLPVQDLFGQFVNKSTARGVECRRVPLVCRDSAEVSPLAAKTPYNCRDPENPQWRLDRTI
jgi:hypothetical protein